MMIAVYIGPIVTHHRKHMRAWWRGGTDPCCGAGPWSMGVRHSTAALCPL